MIGAPSVLVLGLGEGGSYLAQALAAAKTAPTLLAYDAAIASPDAAALHQLVDDGRDATVCVRHAHEVLRYPGHADQRLHSVHWPLEKLEAGGGSK